MGIGAEIKPCVYVYRLGWMWQRTS